MKILIADDSALSRTIVQAALVKWGYEVVSVTNGTEALACLQREDAPPLAIIDVNMPGIDGNEVCQRLRKTPRTTPTYIILLTANATKAAAVTGLDAGADDYVTKPFDNGELRARVQVGVRMIELQGSLAKHIHVLRDTFAQIESNSANLTQLNGKMLKEISDRTRAEEELRLQKILLESQSEASLDGVLVISAEGKILSLNHQFIEIWGIADEVLATRSGAAALQAIADKLDSPAEFLELVDSSRQHTDEKSETEITLKDERILHYYSAPVMSSDGVYYGRASYFRDITQRKRAEEEKEQLIAQIESQRQRLNNIVATVPGFVWEAWGEPDSAAQRIDFVSDYVETMLGYSVEEWLSTPNFWLSIIHPDDREEAAREAAAAFASRTNCTSASRWIARDGHTVWVESNFVVVTDANGLPVGLRGVNTDITERKRTEEELRESAERYRLLFENNPHPMWVYDLESLSFSAINEAAIQHYGYSREEFLTMTVKDIRSREDVPALLENISKVSGGIDEAGIWKHRKKDGSSIDVEITSHEFLFAGRRSELVLANDVTDRRLLEIQLRQAQKLESIGQLAAGISHEINTPTQYVSDNTCFLRDAFQDLLKVHQQYLRLAEACSSGAAPAALLAEVAAAAKEADVDFLIEEIPKAIQQSLEGTQRISKIVQSMKDFAHPGIALKQACDLNRAIDSTITIACNEWKYVANMVTDFDATLPLVPCLQGEFNQVVLNMIINASHAISDVIGDGSSGKGTITISTRCAEPWAEIRVADTGTGIPEANRARIFDPFFTTKQVGKGTGQGLSISHNVVVEKHGGTITLETEEGAGTTFIIRLPLHEATKPPQAPTPL